MRLGITLRCRSGCSVGCCSSFYHEPADETEQNLGLMQVTRSFTDMPSSLAKAVLHSHSEAMQSSTFFLLPSRVHEAQGSGRVFFALWQTMRYPSAVWVAPFLDRELPTASSITFVRADGIDILWAAEEALRSVPGGLVIAQPQKRLSLTEGRRLQLAAEAGCSTGLFLVSDGAGSPATETRWNCTSLAGDSTLHRWEIIKNKKGTLESWILNWDGSSAAFDMVSATGQRCGPADQPG
ncbi:hypothetical protein QCN27_05720 [Cereibacter sp. SYSU M97828]|nr:hypothetical protein [Cereibacter flavus]